MNRLNTYQWLAMGVMVLIIILLSQCNGNLRSKLDLCLQGCEGKERIVRDTIIQADSIPYEVVREVPVPKYVKVPDKSLQAKVDSLIRENKALDALLDYYATRYYADTLLNDSSALIALFDTVSENAIQGRRLMFQNRQPALIKETLTIEKELRFRLFAGGFIGGNKTGSFEAGLSLMAVPKNDNFYVHYSYDAVGNSHLAGIGWKIRFKAP